MNLNPITVKITNSDFFYMIDNQVRDFVPKYEVGIMLQLAERVLEQSEISKNELIEYPVEGYYHKTESLKLYFTIIRNLQMNKGIFTRVVRNSNEFLKLKTFCEDSLFGQEKPYPIDGYENAPIKRKYDVVALTMQDKELFDSTLTRPWDIDSVMNASLKHITGEPNLVELAVMTNDARCVCSGVETNSLYRMMACISGYCNIEPEYIWEVNSKIFEFGHKIVNAYNRLLNSEILITPNIFNHNKLKKIPELPRIALLGHIVETKENYFWILDSHNSLSEKYTTELITTESYIKNL